jgi:ATP-dependent protease ClpP protease subunit
MAVDITLKDYTDEYGYEYVIGMGNNSGSAISQQIQAAKGQKVTLLISSMGGSCYAAVEIVNAIRTHGNVNAQIDGIAFSAAAVIACACKTVTAGTYSMMMIHNSRIFANMWGTMTSEDLRKFADENSSQMDAFDKLQTSIFTAKTGLSADQITEMLSQETWMVGSEAKDLGFIDTLSDAAPDPMATATYNRAFEKAPMRMVAMAAKHITTTDTMNVELKAQLDKQDQELREIKAELGESKGLWATLKEGINSLLGKQPQKAVALTLEDAGSIYIKGDTVAVGEEIFTDEALAVPAADGSVTLNDGQTLIVNDGRVTEIKEPETTVEATAGTEEVEALQKQNGELTALLKEVKAQLAERDKTLTDLANTQSNFTPEERKKEFESGAPSAKVDLSKEAREERKKQYKNKK